MQQQSAKVAAIKSDYDDLSRTVDGPQSVERRLKQEIKSMEQQLSSLETAIRRAGNQFQKRARAKRLQVQQHLLVTLQELSLKLLLLSPQSESSIEKYQKQAKLSDLQSKLRGYDLQISAKEKDQ